MGNDIKNIGDTIGKKLQYYDTSHYMTENGIPTNAQQNIKDVIDLNKLLKGNIINLGCKLQFDIDSLSKNGHKWENSLMRGKISIESEHKEHDNISQENLHKSSNEKVQSSLHKKEQQIQSIISDQPLLQKLNGNKNQNKNHQFEQKQQKGHTIQQKREQHKQKKVEYNIIMTLSEIYELKRLIECYQQQQTQIQKKRRQSDGKLCVICLDNKPDQVLPCAHSYCKVCMNAYVINKDKKCPMCRKSYKESLIENIYQVIEWDEDFVVEMRCIFFKILEKHNPREVRKIKHRLEVTPGANQDEKTQKMVTQ